jgi:hypothetical protein
MMRIMSPTGLLNKNWDDELKKNNAFEKRFDRPYADTEEGARRREP